MFTPRKSDSHRAYHRSTSARQIELGFFRASIALTVYEYLLTFEQGHHQECPKTTPSSTRTVELTPTVTATLTATVSYVFV